MAQLNWGSDVYYVTRRLGFRLQASGFGLQLRASGFRLRASGFRLQASGFRLQASGFRLAFKVVVFPLLTIASAEKQVPLRLRRFE
jgi:hypothetical protein